MSSFPHERGVVYLHSVPRHLCAHAQWAVLRALGENRTDTADLVWSEQPVTPGAMRSHAQWRGPAGAAAAMASELATFPGIRFEVTQEPEGDACGQRFAFTPTLGLWRGVMNSLGQTTVTEDQLRTALDDALALGRPVTAAVDDLLGTPWDHELESFRWAGEGAVVRWLTQVG